MNLIDLKENERVKKSTKSTKYFNQIELIIQDLRERSIQENLITVINSDIAEINDSELSDYALHKLLKRKYNNIIKITEKELHIVPINYYRNLWMVIGMSAFGIPMGLALGVSLGNIGLLGIGLPIGMAVGIAVGMGLDKKAHDERRQFDFEIIY